MERFVGNDWKLVSTRSARLEEWHDEMRDIQFLLTCFEDGREIWATYFEVVELHPKNNKVLRRAKMYGLYCVDSKKVTPVFSNADGCYLIFCARSPNGTPTVWRLNLDSNLKLELLGQYPNWTGFSMSSDGSWVAGIKNVNGRGTCVRSEVDHRVTKQRHPRKIEMCVRPNKTVLEVHGVETSGSVVFSSGLISSQDSRNVLTEAGIWYWGIDGRMIDVQSETPSLGWTVPRGIHSVGLQTYHISFTDSSSIIRSIDDNFQFRAGHDGKERIVPASWWIIRSGLFTSEVMELLELSTLPHHDALLAICPTQTMRDVRWNDTKTRISVIWKESVYPKRPTFHRTELRVVSASDSLINACAAKLASAGNAFDWLSEELNTLISSFRDAGWFLRRKPVE
jgi:hypothetical protein